MDNSVLSYGIHNIMYTYANLLIFTNINQKYSQFKIVQWHMLDP